MSHVTFTLLMALLISGAVALPGDRSGRERVYSAAYTFLVCVASIVGGGWLMYLVHG
jgi:hypothetical protein